MKTTLTFLIVFLCSITMAVHAQIPNPGFENWTSGDPDGWATSNVFPASLVNITQTADNHSGSSALRGEVVDYLGAPIAPIIQSGPGGTGFAISEQYHSFELYYKFMPNGGDRFAVNVALNKNGSPIAQGAVALPATIASYTHLTVPLNYTTSDVPDAAIIQISINGPNTGIDLHLGSVMFLDDLSFSLFTGIESTVVPDAIGKCFPNPASDIVNIPLNVNLTGESTLQVFNTCGREVKTMKCRQDGKNVFQFPVEDLSPGIYLFSVNGQTGRYHGKFSVSR